MSEPLNRWIDTHFEDEVRFLQALVRVPTDTPPGNNAPHAERTADLLAGLGFTVEQHAVPAADVQAAGLQSITNLIVRHRFSDDGPTIALNAHGDVVPPGEGWTHDPYGAEVVDGRLYGRAAAVSKSDFATYTYALLALKHAGLPLKGAVFVSLRDADKENVLPAMRDLVALEPKADAAPPTREIVVRLQGNMERYIWTINDKKFSEADPIRLKYGERVRLKFTNETMMAHPMHLHGMFVQLENGQPAAKLPNKHTVIVPPGGSYSVLLTADEIGEWAFHCHLLYHMSSGMMRQVVVAKLDAADMPTGSTNIEGEQHAH